MIVKRFLGAAGVGILCGSLGVLAACGDNTDSEAAESAAQALSNANVSITLHDENGTAVGQGSGVLIAPRLVLTSAHLVAGKAKWTVRTADGKAATGKRGLTKDWHVYESMKSHPRKNDVAVIYLDQDIKLAAYPKLATKRVATGAEATRVRNTQTGFQMVAAKLDRFRGFPNSYVTDIPTTETLDTGGAVVNESGEIIGLVTGRGLTTGKLYIARVDKLVRWLSPKIKCAGGAPDALNVLTTGAPPPKPGCKKDAGAGGASSSGGDDGTSSSGGSSSGGDGETGTCEGDDDGLCSGECGPGGGGSSSGSSGSDNGESSSSSSSGGSSSGEGGSSSGGSSSGSSGSDNGESSSGGSSSGGSGSDDPTSSSGGGGSGGDEGDEEVCEGEDDNPDLCPPESSDCSGPDCGGGQPDDFIDYGKCACTMPPGSSGPVILR